MAPDLPTGTVTFLFTDIEGSTQLWQRFPKMMSAALRRHHEILQGAVETHHGYVFQIIGDAFCSAFHTALDALMASMEAQRLLQAEAWGEMEPIRVRMAMHSGTAEIHPGETKSGEYASNLTLSRAARLLSAGHGGQVLLSQATVELLPSYLAEIAELRDLGEHHLKDLQRPEHIYQLVAIDLPSNYPPLKTLDNYMPGAASPSNLPLELTKFIKRDRELVEAQELLSSARLLTFIGPGGIGKTRLSIQLGAEVMPAFRDGVWLVELEPLTEPDLILHSITAIFGLRELPGVPVINLITDYLRARHLLMILDNCEHFVDACAELAKQLLQSCPHLKILATSREALGIASENVYSIPPLSNPEASDCSLDELLRYQAIQLFVERALEIEPRFALNDKNAPAISQICKRLDGIPLAIELAASRIRLFTPNQIAERLDQRFRLLSSGHRAAVPHQQTLRALIDWSYDTLPDLERVLFRQLSVCAGGWSFEAAEAIGREEEALDLLAALINKSLVVVEPVDGENRYHYLETIRQYAYEKLVESDELEETRFRHLNFYMALVEAAESKLRGPDMILWLDRLELEQDNLRSALDYALDNNPIKSLQIVASLCYFWSRRASATEGLSWIKAALERAEASLDTQSQTEPAYLAARAEALAAEAALAFDRGDNLTSRNAAEESVTLARQVNAQRTLAWSLSVGAKPIFLLGDHSLAHSWAKQAITLSRQYGYLFELGLALSALQLSADLENLTEIRALRTEVLPMLRQGGNPWVLTLNTFDAAHVEEMSGNLSEALAGYEESARLFKTMGDRQYHCASRSQLAHKLRQHGLYPESLTIYRETIHLWYAIGHLAAVAHELECFAFIAGEQGQSPRATTLLGAAEVIRQESNSPMSSNERTEYERMLALLHTNVDQAMFDRFWFDGRSMTVEQAISFALA